jgi:hypothetical protein
VEVHGNGTRKVLDEFEGRLRMGPMGSDVRGFEVVDAAVVEAAGFSIR